MKTNPIEERIEKLEYTQTAIIITLLILAIAILGISIYGISKLSQKKSDVNFHAKVMNAMGETPVELFLNDTIEYSLELASDIPVSSKEESNRYGYNVKTDQWINSILDTDPIETEINYDNTYFRFRWPEIEISIYYDEFIPYKQEESYSIYCRASDGQLIMLESPLELPQHRINDKTIQRIIGLCKD